MPNIKTVVLAIALAFILLPHYSEAATTYTNISMITNPSFENGEDAVLKETGNWSDDYMLLDLGVMLTKNSLRVNARAFDGTFALQFNSTTNAGDDNVWSQIIKSQNSSAFAEITGANSDNLTVFLDWSFKVNTTPTSGTGDNGSYAAMLIQFDTTLTRMHYVSPLWERRGFARANSSTDCYIRLDNINKTVTGIGAPWYNYSRNVTKDAASCGVQTPWAVVNVTPSMIIITAAQAARSPHTRLDFDAIQMNVLSVSTTADPPPRFSSNVARLNSSQYNRFHNHSFEVNWTKTTNAISNVSFETNITGTLLNYSFATIPRITIANVGTTTERYYINFTNIAAGNYSFRWFANDTTGSENATATLIYQILRNTSPRVSIAFNATSPLIYGNATEAWANFTVLQADHGATITLRRGGSNVASGTGNQTEKAILGVAAHSYDAVYSESQNYSQLTTSASTFTINKAGAAVNLVINGTRGYRNFSINEYVNFTVNVSAVIPQGINPLIEIWTNYTTTNGWKLWNESRVSGSVKYFSNITRLTAAGIYNFSANFTNENYTAYGTAFEAWYINITAASTDAAFSVAVPSDWTLNDITGTTEGSATAIPLSGFISFNMSLYGDSNFSQPNVDGVFTQNQSGASFPIYWIRNDGNVDITIQLRLDANPPAGIVIFANSSCATCTSGQAAPLTLTTSYQTFATGLGQGAPNYANITLWANASFNQAAGQNSINLYNCGKEPSATC